jgi:hypothetical protein
MRNVLVTIGGRLTIVGAVHDVDVMQPVEWRFRFAGNNGAAQLFVVSQSGAGFSVAFDGADVVVTSTGTTLTGQRTLTLQAVDQDRVTREFYEWRVRRMTPRFRITAEGDQRITAEGDVRIVAGE